MEKGLVDILSFGLLGGSSSGGDQSRGLRVAIKRLCEELLPEAIGLSDGFGFSDWELDRSIVLGEMTEGDANEHDAVHSEYMMGTCTKPCTRGPSPSL